MNICSGNSTCPKQGIRILVLLLLAIFFPPVLSASSSVSLAWDANRETNLAGYHIYRALDSPNRFVRLNTSLNPLPSFTDSTVVAGNTYFYTVTAVNDSGQESGFSNPVTVTLPAGNRAPSALDDEVTVAASHSIEINVLANDSDPDGDPLQVISVGQASAGSVTIVSTSLVRYVAESGFIGVDSFVYTVADSEGATATARVNIRVRVEGNRPPQAVDDTATTQEDVPVTVGVLKNDSDPDGDELTIAQLSQPANGRATLVGSDAIRYVPGRDFHGVSSFSYTIADGFGGTATAQVTITVTPVNDPPQAGNDSVTTRSEAPVTIDVLDNDFDPEDDPLKITQVTSPSTGSVTIEGETRLVYVPELDFTGAVSFFYTVADPEGETDTAQVTVEVTEPVSEGEPIFLPATLNSGNPFFLDTFVGVALLNPDLQAKSVTVSSVDSQGTRLLTIDLPEVPPRGQLSFLSSEPLLLSSTATALRVEGVGSSLRGLFLAGTRSADRLDGVDSNPPSSTTLYFPMARENQEQSTLLFLFNPSAEAAFNISLKLYDRFGLLLKEQAAALAPGGSISGNLDDIFSKELDEGYVRVDSSVALQGFELLGDEKNFAALSGQPEQRASRLLAPHFFVSNNGKDTSVLRLLNQESRVVQVTIRAFDDSSNLITQEKLELSAGHLLVKDVRDLLQNQLSGLPAEAALTGFLKIDVRAPISLSKPVVSGSVTFFTNRRTSMTTLPLVAEGRKELIFPHVAQNQANQLFTGLSILNPGTETANVTLSVFNEQGTQTSERSFDLGPGQRRIDLLNGDALLGPSFDQMNGHIRLTSDQPVIAFAIFGNFRGDFLSAIGGQAAD